MKKRKVVASMMAVILALSLAGCGSSGSSGSSDSSDTKVANKDKPLCWFNRQPSNSSTGELPLITYLLKSDPSPFFVE